MAISRSEFIKRVAIGVASIVCACSPATVIELGRPTSPVSCAFASEGPNASEAQESQASSGDALACRILLATDIHYRSPRYVSSNEGSVADFGSMVTSYTDQIADALVATVIERHPDLFVMPGDLSYDGEVESLEDLVPKFRRIADAGIPVLVIPGNHDIRPANTVSTGTTASLFAELYHEFGPAQALSCDDASLSFVYEFSPALRLLFVDVNAVEEMGTLPASTLEWVRGQLEDARAADARVIGFSHQLTSDGGGYHGVTVDNSAELRALYERYGVAVNFSGHIHSQSLYMETFAQEGGMGGARNAGGVDGANGTHATDGMGDAGSGSGGTTISAYSSLPKREGSGTTAPTAMSEDGVKGEDAAGGEGATGADAEGARTYYDLATSCLSIYPLRFANIDVTSERIAYNTEYLDVDAWARTTGSDDPNLLDFARYARSHLHDTQYQIMHGVLEGLDGLTDDERDAIATYFADVNCGYVDGTVGDVEIRDDLAERFFEVAEGTAARLGYGLFPQNLSTVDATTLLVERW